MKGNELGTRRLRVLSMLTAVLMLVTMMPPAALATPGDSENDPKTVYNVEWHWGKNLGTERTSYTQPSIPEFNGTADDPLNYEDDDFKYTFNGWDEVSRKEGYAYEESGDGWLKPIFVVFNASYTKVCKGEHTYPDPRSENIKWTLSYNDDGTINRAIITLLCEKCQQQIHEEEAWGEYDKNPPCVGEAIQANYTAMVDINGKTYTYTTEATLKPLGRHFYYFSDKWKWSDDLTRAYAIFVCENDTDTLDVEAEVTDNGAKANCEGEDVKLVYTATVKWQVV